MQRIIVIGSIFYPIKDHSYEQLLNCDKFFIFSVDQASRWSQLQLCLRCGNYVRLPVMLVNCREVVRQQLMWKKYIISIEEQHSYPFDGPKPPFQLVVVRLTHSARTDQPFSLLQRKLDRLIQAASPFLVGVLSLKQLRQRSLTLDYEYVPEALAKSPRTAEAGFVAAVREKLQECLARLAEAGIRTELRLESLGVTAGGEPKLFVGLNFQLVEQNQRKALAAEYQATLDRLLEAQFGFRYSLHGHSDTQKSEYSQRVDRRLTEMEGKLSKLRLKSPHSSSSEGGKSQREPNIVLQAVTSRDSNNSSFTAGTSYSLINHPPPRPKVHKSSFGDYSTSSYRLNEQSVREDSLKKRVNHALEKTQQAFKIYQKYSRRKRRA